MNGRNTLYHANKQPFFFKWKQVVNIYDHHKEAIIRWCEQHLRWTGQDWGSVLFSDESSFTLSHSEMRSVVYRRTNERYDPLMIVETTNKGYGCVMVWGGIIGDRKTRLVKAEG